MINKIELRLNRTVKKIKKSDSEIPGLQFLGKAEFRKLRLAGKKVISKKWRGLSVQLLILDLDENRIMGNAKAKDIKKLGLFKASANRKVSASEDLVEMTDEEASSLFYRDCDEQCDFTDEE